MYSPKTKQLDRFILFEIGLIIALLLVNGFLELDYQSTTPVVTTDPTNWDTLVTLTYPMQTEPEQDPAPESQMAQMNLFDPSALIKQVDELFKTKKPQLDPSKLPYRKGKGRIQFIRFDDQSTKIDTIVEQMPHFPGGDMALKRFVQDNYHTTDAMYDYGRRVQLMVSFVVRKDGEVTDYHVVSSSMSGLGAERSAIRLFEKMPNWVPGDNGSGAVNVRVLLPLTIQIR